MTDNKNNTTANWTITDYQMDHKKTCDEANNGSEDVSHWGKRRIEGFHAKYPRQQILYGRIYNRDLSPFVPKVCCLCGGDAGRYGNNPAPVPHQQGDEDRCCDFCNSTKVIPARMLYMESE